MTYNEILASFRPQFGNANHIAALPLIAEIRRLENSLSKLKEGSKRVPKLAREITALEQRVINLLKPGARLSTYPPTSPQL